MSSHSNTKLAQMSAETSPLVWKRQEPTRLNEPLSRIDNGFEHSDMHYRLIPSSFPLSFSSAPSPMVKSPS
jgi:hypothetical protein